MSEQASIKSTRRLAETAIMLALATALSYVMIPKVFGGSVTLFSQVPIIVIGYRYGSKWGCVTGIIYSLLQLILQGLGNFAYVKGIGAYIILVLADYVIAFMALGLAGGLFRKCVKNQTLALSLGAIAGSLLRFLCHFISGVTIWGEYANGFKSVWAYSAVYNGSYMLPEAVLSVIGVVALSLILDFKSESLRRKKS